MKKGDVVTVYENPLNQKKVEGRAVLLRKVRLNSRYYQSDRFEYWKVKFLPGDFVANRFLSKT